MTYPDYCPPETWGRGLLALTTGDHFEMHVARCRRVEYLRAAVRAEATRRRDPRPQRIAQINQRIDELS